MAPDQRPILVLGGSGFLGPHVVAAASAEARVVAVSRRSRAAPLAPCATPERIELREADLCAPRTVERLVAELAPRAVIAVAAMARAADCERDPAAAERANAELPARVAASAREAGARLVQVSTDLVFGEALPPPGGFDEAAPPAPLHVYGRTKAAGERAALAADPGALVVRLPLLYGGSFGRALGASDALLAAVDRGERPMLFADEWRTPLEVGAAARALVELALGGPAGILHVAGPDRVTRLELGLAVLRARGAGAAEAEALVRAGARADLGLAATRAEDVSLDSRRARALLRARLPGVAEGLAAGAS